MRYFTAHEIIRSLMVSIAFGLSCGCIYTASVSIFSAIKRLLLIIPSVFRKLNGSVCETVKSRKEKLGFFKNLAELFLFLFFGICLNLLIYVTLDGVFRLYVPIVACIFFVVGKKSAGRIFEICFNYIFNLIYKLLFGMLSVILTPVYKLSRKLAALISARLFSPVNACILTYNSNRLQKRKIMTAINFIK